MSAIVVLMMTLLAHASLITGWRALIHDRLDIAIRPSTPRWWRATCIMPSCILPQQQNHDRRVLASWKCRSSVNLPFWFCDL